MEGKKKEIWKKKEKEESEVLYLRNIDEDLKNVHYRGKLLPNISKSKKI